MRLSRRPIERYEWPLGGALIALALSILIPERKRVRERAHVPAPARNAGRNVASEPVKAVGAAVAVLLLLCSSVFATAPGINAYQQGKFEDAYKEFQDTLKSHPQSRAEDELQFDSGTAAYKLKDYNKALESFSQALLTPDTGLQTKGHYNLGNTLYQRGEMQKSDDKKLSDWTNALDHYEQTLKLNPQNKEAKDNYEYVKKKIDELKNKKEQQQQQPSPSPTPPQKNKQNKQDQQQKQQNQQNQDKQQQQKDQQQKDQQQQQTTTTTTATKPESAGSKGSAAGTKPAVAKGRGHRQTAKRTTAEGPVSGEKRTAKETAAATRRESISLARRRKAAGQTAFALAGTTTG